MRRMIKSVSVGGFLGLVVLAFILMSGKNNPEPNTAIAAAPMLNTASPDFAATAASADAASPVTNTISAAEKLKEEAMAVYDSMDLNKFGLSKKAFEYA